MLNDTIYYVYRHIRLDKNEPFYIGISSKKPNHKYQRAFKLRERNMIWHNVFNACNGNVEVEIIYESFDKSETKAKETEFILLYGRKNNNTGILANLTDGGDGAVGAVYTEERRVKQSNSMRNSIYSLKGKKLPEWWRDRIRQTKFGADNPMYGKVTAAAKSVINVVSGEIFPTIKSAAASIKKTDKFLYQNLDGHNKKNRTLFLYLDKYNEVGKENAIKLTNQAPVELKKSQRLIVDVTTGEKYFGLESCLHLTTYCKVHLNNMLLGKHKNKTNLKYA